MKKKVLLLAASAAMALGVGGIAIGAGIHADNAIVSTKAGTAGSATLSVTSPLSATATAIGGDTNVTIKTSSTNNYSNPLRIYSGVTVTIATASSDILITSIVYTASQTGNYVTYASGATVSPSATPTTSETVITWTYAESAAVTTWTFKPSGQTRCAGLVVNYVNNGSQTALQSVAATDVALKPGRTGKTTLTFTPNNATDKSVSYAITSGSDVASVASDGTITGLKAGTATLTVTPTDTNAPATTATITVTDYAAPTGITVGKKYAITAHDETNSVYAELTGFASNLGTSTQYTSDPSCDYPFTVVNGYYPNTVAFKNGSNYISFPSGTSNYLTTSTTVDAASSWEVSYTGTEEDGYVYSVRNILDYTRYLQYNYNKGSDRFSTYVGESQVHPIFVEVPDGIELTDFTIDSTAEVYVGSTTTISASYTPNNATDKTLDWSTSDASIATVSDGVVTGVAAGTATITASKQCNGETIFRTCNVTVKAAAAEHAGTLADPYTITEAKALAAGTISGTKTGVYVKGIITSVSASSSKYTISIWMGDDASQTNANKGGFEIYLLSGVTSDTYASMVAPLKVGATIIASGDITSYTSSAGVTTYEFDSGTGSIGYNSYANAMTWGSDFLSAIASTCETTKNNGFNTAVPSALEEIMMHQGDDYSELPNVEKAHIVAATANASGDTLEQGVAAYDYIVKKYTGVTEFITGRVVSSASSISSFETSKTNVLPIAVIAASGLLATAGIFLVRRKHLGK